MEDISVRGRFFDREREGGEDIIRHGGLLGPVGGYRGLSAGASEKRRSRKPVGPSLEDSFLAGRDCR